MDQNPNDLFPWRNNSSEQTDSSEPPRKLGGRKCSITTLCLVVCLAVLISVMGTYSITSSHLRASYVTQLQENNQKIQDLQAALRDVTASDDSEFGKLAFLSRLFQESSYYADTVSHEERLEAVLKAYTVSMGDDYAEYYTEEEYAQIIAENIGDYEGIGVNVLQTDLTVNGIRYLTFQLVSVYANSPAQKAGLKPGDYIYAILSGENYLTVKEIGGYTAGLSAMRGEKGTQADFKVFRKSGDEWNSLSFSVVRDAYTVPAVTHTVAEADPTVGIVKIHRFNMQTPKELKTSMSDLKARGIERYVFDVRLDVDQGGAYLFFTRG